jgi:O-antigen ligase
MKGMAEKSMFYGFCGTIFFIPLATSPAVIISLGTICIWILSGRFIKDGRALIRQEWFFPVILFMALPWAGLIYTSDLQRGLVLAQKSHYWLLAFAMASLTLRHEQIRILFNVFLSGLSVTAVICIFQFAGMVPKTKEAQIGFINPITYIHLLVFGMMVLAYYFGREQDRTRRIFYGAGLILFCLNIFFYAGAPGRTAYLSFFFLLPVMVHNILGKRHLVKIAAACLLIAIALSTTVLVRGTLKDINEQINAYYEGNPNTSMGLRLHMWESALKIILENPLIGVGTGGYRNAMKNLESPRLAPENREFNQPHNSFLFMIVQYGIIGLVSIIWLMYVFIEKGWLYRKTLPGFAIFSFGLILVIGSLTDTQIIQVHTATLLAILTGLQRSLNEIYMPSYSI